MDKLVKFNNMNPNVGKFLGLVGLATVTNFACSLGGWFWANFGPSTNLRTYGAGRGAFAMVTGSTDGIGLSIAFEAAGHGFNLILISRNENSLKIVADQISSRYPGIAVLTIAVDCSVDSTANFEKIMKVVDSLNVTVLVNNVGAANDSGDPCCLECQAAETISNILNINCTFTSKLTSLMIPVIKRGRENIEASTKLKCRGGIAVISSFLSLVPAGYFTIYSSSKQFLNHFVECVACELYGSNIDVFSSIPAHVCSKMSKISQPSLMVPDAPTFARAFWSKFGRNTQVVPYLPHSFMAVFAAAVPRWFLVKSLRDALKPK